MSNNQIECIICLNSPKLPVATQCGHIFCWHCLKSWLDSQSVLVCPVCKNGIEMDRIVKLYTNDENNKGEVDDRPQSRRTEPIQNNNRPSFFQNFLNNFGFYGVNNENINNRLPDAKEVKRNKMALFFLVIGIILILYIFNR